MWSGNLLLFSYLNGVFASLGGCTLPVLSMLVAKIKEEKFNAWKFLLEFFLAQFLIFATINTAIGYFYSIFEWIQPIFLLLASILTFLIAYSLYTGRPLPVPAMGGIYGIALSPCSVGFAIAVASSSVTPLLGVINALAFALGIMTPILAFTVAIGTVRPLMEKSSLLERASVILLLLVSYYLAYLAGASWRWIP